MARCVLHLPVVLITSVLLPLYTRSSGELMEEVNRQSSLANRVMVLSELHNVQRDAMYEETKLVVKYKQGA